MTDKSGILRVGHRGACGLAPENTLASFRKALELGVDAIELDLHQTKDGQLIVMHDASVDRTTNGKGKIKDMTLEELKKLDAGSWFSRDYTGERIPTLQEAIDVIKGKAKLFIEIKQPGIEEKVVEEIRKNEIFKDVWVISFYPESIQRTKELSSEIKTGLLTSHPGDLDKAVSVKAEVFSIEYHNASAQLVKRTHQKGLLISLWTVNDPKDMKKMIHLAPDILASDFPDRLNSVLQSE